MNKKTNIILSIALIIVISSVIFIYISLNQNNNISSDQNNSEDENNQENHIPDEPPDEAMVESITPVLTVELDRYNKTIKIISIEKGTNLLWSNVELITGSATFPEGTIGEGDMITNCKEILDFLWIPTDEVFLHVEFVRGE